MHIVHAAELLDQSLEMMLGGGGLRQQLARLAQQRLLHAGRRGRAGRVDLADGVGQRTGRRAGVLDADITGPSIPKAFGVSECASADEEGIYPAVTESGIQIMSVNLLLEHEDDPVLWRGPIIAGAVKQFWTDVVWENVDYLFVDMPPGTGDVPLTVFQSLPVDGIVIVTSPQELVSMIVAKAVRMAEMMHVPVIGLVENYSYFRCPDCGKCHQIFGKSHLDETAQAYHLPVLARLPIDPAVAEACDAGRVESLDTTELEPALQAILAR